MACRFMLPVEEQTEPEGALTPVSSVPQVTLQAAEPQQLTRLAPHWWVRQLSVRPSTPCQACRLTSHRVRRLRVALTPSQGR